MRRRTSTARRDGRRWIPATALFRLLVALLVALPFATPASAQPGDSQPDLLLPPAEGERRPRLGVEASRELGEPLGQPLSGDELERAVAEVAADIRCPKCQALSIADSAAESARAMREEARSLLAAGYTGGQVARYFEQRYGEFVLLEPRARGLNLIVWTAPAAMVLLGALLVAHRLRQRRRTGEEALDDYLARVKQETAT